MSFRKEFIAAYVECMLWSTNDESTPVGGVPLDDNYSCEDIAPAAMIAIESDCDKFIAENAADLEDTDPAQAGHDFWLTRVGHGAGFWDGDWPEEQGARLTRSSEKFGEVWPYVGDDGQVYV